MNYYKEDRACCAVLALQHATDLSFEESQALLAYFGRKKNRATHISKIERAIRLTLSTKEKEEYKLSTVRRVIDDLPKSGVFIISVRGHIFTYKDGEIKDWLEDNSRKRVERVWFVSAKKRNAKISRAIESGRKKLSKKVRKI